MIRLYASRQVYVWNNDVSEAQVAQGFFENERDASRWVRHSQSIQQWLKVFYFRFQVATFWGLWRHELWKQVSSDELRQVRAA